MRESDAHRVCESVGDPIFGVFLGAVLGEECLRLINFVIISNQLSINMEGQTTS